MQGPLLPGRAPVKDLSDIYLLTRGRCENGDEKKEEEGERGDVEAGR